MQTDINKVFDIGKVVILSDPSAVSGTLNGDLLTLSAKTEFALNMLDAPDIKQKLSAIAAKLRGRETQVKFVLAGEDSPAAPSVDKLGELGRFGVVKFQ